MNFMRYILLYSDSFAFYILAHFVDEIDADKFIKLILG